LSYDSSYNNSKKIIFCFNNKQYPTNFIKTFLEMLVLEGYDIKL